MATNPSKQGAILNPATQRGSKLNDPQFYLNMGYSAFDLTHHEVLTPRFGECTPFMHLDTVPADRMVINSNIKSIHNRIDGNLLSTVNQYDETFFVSLANLIPNAYERFIPNPVKGDDLPNAALPQIPFELFLANMLYNNSVIRIDHYYSGKDSTNSFNHNVAFDIDQYAGLNPSSSILSRFNYANDYMLLLATILSRGQLLDYLGLQYDVPYQLDSRRSIYNSEFQYFIDEYFSKFSTLVSKYCTGYSTYSFYDVDKRQDLTSNDYIFTYKEDARPAIVSLSQFRDVLNEAFERGEMPLFTISVDEDDEYWVAFKNAYIRLHNALLGMFDYMFDIMDDTLIVPTINDINSSATPFERGFINPLKPLAYQLCIAQYFTNDIIDNIYTSDLFMQNLRSVMFPSINNLSTEPTYTYNGVEFEYDLMTFGAFQRSFFGAFEGNLKRAYLFSTIMFYLRRSLRYGDMFSTCRPNMLAVGDMYINVVDGKVSPVDVTKNLLMQRYLNMANYRGQRIDSLYASVYGVIPSDRPVCPRYISHRKTKLAGKLTENTAELQGKQTTNLIGFTDSDNGALDVFLDDYGVILSIVSYDVLPIYTSGFDASYRFSDRFDYYNPQLQNIGDQPVVRSELFGDSSLNDVVFGYQMRNAELKYKVSRAHGGLVNDLPGYVFKYPPRMYLGDGKISPEFIRDKPMYFDQLATLMTGTSPANYYHFIVSAVNQVSAARKMQATPPILF